MDHSVTSAIEALAHENTFDPARALEFWQRAGSPDFSKTIVYRTGLKVDWITHIVQEDDVLRRDDFFKVAHAHGLPTRDMIICTGVDASKVEAVLLKGGLDVKTVGEMLIFIRTIQNTASLLIKTQAHIHEVRPMPGYVPETASQTLH